MTTLRAATPGDARAIAEIYGPIVASTPVSFELASPSIEEIERRVTSTLEYAPWLVCERDGAIAAYAYASRHRDRAAYQWAVDASVYVHHAHRRRGLGRALYVALFEVCRAQGFVAAHAGITLPNAASVALHESLGFRPIGVYPKIGYKMGAWHDVGWWQLELRTRETEPPSPPIPFSRLCAAPELEAALAKGLAELG